MVVPHEPPEMHGVPFVLHDPRNYVDRPAPTAQTLQTSFLGMLWIYLAAASATTAGPTDALIGFVSSSICIFVVYFATTRRGGPLRAVRPRASRRDSSGRVAVTIIVTATATAIAVLQGSILAQVVNEGLGVDRSTSSVLVVAAAAALQSRRLRWGPFLDRYLSFTYGIGLIVIVMGATVRRHDGVAWQSPTLAVQYPPGWVSAFLVFMGAWVMTGYVLRYGRRRDVIGSSPLPTRPVEVSHHAAVASLIGVVGVVLACLGRSDGTIAATVSSVIAALGGYGVVLLILVLVRLSEAHYASAAAGWQELIHGLIGRRASRWVGITVTCAVVYLLLDDGATRPVLDLLRALGAVVVAWALVALASSWTSRTRRRREGTD